MTDFKKDNHDEDMWLEYIRSTTCDYAKECIAAKTLQIPSIQGIIRHLPIVGTEESLSPEGYEKCLNMVAECLVKLWIYCKEMDFVKEDTQLDTFVRNGLDFSIFKGESDCPYSKVVHDDFAKLATWMVGHNYTM